MNGKCPNCGGQLVADALAKFTSVPLRGDGYIPGEGNMDYSEISNIRCIECGCKVSTEYYHEVESRLKSAVCAATTKCNTHNPGDGEG